VSGFRAAGNRSATGDEAAMISLALDFEQGIGTVTLQRPPVNGLNADWVERFAAVLDEVESSSGLAALRIRSACPVFSAGGDLAFMRANFDSVDGRERIQHFVGGCQRQLARLAAMPLVSVAQIGGPAMGGGLELALACDFRIIAADARLALPEVGLGLIPGAGGTQRLTQLAGTAVARRLILGAEPVDAATAVRWGICDQIIDAGELEAATLAFCARIRGLSAAGIAQAKRCIGAALAADRDGYGEELEATRILMADADTQERIRRFFSRR